jgi:Dolichyl-phosphate-mannose-protein mannosyltransferase
MRLPATLLVAATVVLAAATAAELGGRRRAQLVAAVATAICPYLLATGHLLATSTVDPFCWVLLLWVIVRWIRTDRQGRPRDRLLLAAGLVTAVALADKMLIPVLLVGLLVGVLVSGPRRMLTRPALWAGMALAALSTVPTLWWQADHGWPQAAMGSVVAGESVLFGDRWQFLPRALWYAGLVPGAVLVLVGLWVLLRRPELRPWRCVGVAAVVVTVVLLAAGGRPYYLTGLEVVLFAAGAVAVQGRRPASWWRWTLSPACFVVSAAFAVVVAMPVGTASWRTGELHDFQVMGQVGWPEMADSVAARYAALPPEQRARTAVVAYSYWYASALEHEGPARGLPATVYSPHRGFGYFGPPPDTATTVLLVGPVRWAHTACAPLVVLPPHRVPLRNPVNDDVPLALCTPRAPWSQAWESLRYMD